ncbi:MAG: C_GCAxxG_C_C family protein [Lachnospiraceae bacterium]|nr:C_GCAxxG_C_C family protein [Lachnospiraceae bacterium]
MTDFETAARNNHKSGMNCATAVYNALGTVNENKTTPPMPRAEGGKCGTVLAAKQIIFEMGGTQEKADEFDRKFSEQFGSLKCSELRGMLRNKCNDYVGFAAATVADMVNNQQQ